MTFSTALRRNKNAAITDAEAQGPGHDRWLVSYADFMTLLMAFFVVMYSISQVSEQKYRVLSETFSDAFKSPDDVEQLVQEGEPQRSHTKTPIDLDGTALEDRPGNDANSVPETFTQIQQQLEQSFQALVDTELITVTGDERWLQIELPSAVLFRSGGTQLSGPAEAIVRELAAALEGYNNVIRVEGFTDNVPLSGGAYSSNWELSAARATAVVKLLADNGIDPARLAAVGYGEYQPIASNKTEEGRNRNRRIVLMVSTQHQLRDDVFVEADVAPVDQYGYLQREPLPEGTLVRGLESTALEQARAWLQRRYQSTLVEISEADSTADDSQQAVANGSAAAAALDRNIDSVQLQSGALLFTSPTDNASDNVILR